MKIIRDIKNLNFNIPIVASIGAFDGIHIGHQEIISNIVQQAKIENSKSALITFYPLPKVFFTRENFEILPIYKKIDILSKFNLDYLVIIRFNDKFASMTSKDFIEDLVIKKLNIKSLTVGEDFKFGHNQTGNINELKDYAFYDLSEFLIMYPYYAYFFLRLKHMTSTLCLPSKKGLFHVYKK